jgi:HSP20 family protein
MPFMPNRWGEKRSGQCHDGKRRPHDTGERTQEQTEGGRKHHRVERTYGRFARSFVLPDTVDAGKASAEYAEGMLHLHLPKSEKAKPKQIEVKIG